MPMANFSQPYITIFVYEKGLLIPKFCIASINCPFHTEFYLSIGLVHTHVWLHYDWLKVAFGIFFPRQTCCRHPLTGGMNTTLLNNTTQDGNTEFWGLVSFFTEAGAGLVGAKWPKLVQKLKSSYKTMVSCVLPFD